MMDLMRWLHRPIYRYRVATLVRHIAPRLREGDRVLDVGCGSGMLGRSLLDSPLRPANLHVTGLERAGRNVEMIPAQYYGGGRMPFASAAFDVVILADVLHHESDPHQLLDECARVSRRLIVIKDHVKSGILAQARISVLDWAANRPYGVSCLYRYNSRGELCCRRSFIVFAGRLTTLRVCRGRPAAGRMNSQTDHRALPAHKRQLP